MMKFNRMRCPVCNRMFASESAWCSHVSVKHPDYIQPGFTVRQALYHLQVETRFKRRCEGGRCAVCGRPTAWNEQGGKYCRLCGSTECRKEYSKQHGTESDEQQRRMLSNRSITHEYNYDGTILEYSSSLEFDAIKWFAAIHWPADDILMPSPHTYKYSYQNDNDRTAVHAELRSYTPDIFIPSLYIEIEVKSHTNGHHKIQDIDRVKEAAKDKMMLGLKKVNYVKIVDKDYKDLIAMIKKLKGGIFDYEAETTIDKFKSPFKNTKAASESFMSLYDTEAESVVFERSKIDDAFTYINDTGIKLIHWCDTIEELDDMYKEWVDMPQLQKNDSDTMSDQLFRMDNVEHYRYLRELLMNGHSVEYSNPFADDEAYSEGSESWMNKYVDLQSTSNGDELAIATEADNTPSFEYITWYSKCFTGRGLGLGNIEIRNLSKASTVEVKGGMIYIKKIMAYTLFNRMQKTYHSQNVKNLFLLQYNEKSWTRYKKKKISKNQLKIEYIYAPVFFALELVEIFNTLGDNYNDANYLNIAELIYRNTWLSSSDTNGSNTQPYSLDALKNLDMELLPYQKEFIQNYPRLKAGLNLNGYILAFEQGLGKTLTSIALAECGKFDHVYVVCPNSLCENWALEIRKYYLKYRDNEDLWKSEVILCKNDKTSGSRGKFFIVNNESIKSMVPFIMSGKNLLIVDESHNFRNLNGKRTKELIELQKKIKANDTLLMSGTPIKAIPNEISPALYLLDPLFTEDVAKLYVKAFNINNVSASDMINKRFGKIIYRKDKSEIDNLPEKFISEIYYKLPNSDEYIFKNLKSKIYNRFMEIYQEKMIDNKELMKEMISLVKKYSKASGENTTLYCKWLTTVNTERIMKLHDSEKDMIEDFLNVYVYPNLPNEVTLYHMKQLETKFIRMKNSALGTAMGEILPPARRDLFIDLFNVNIDDIVDRILNNDKKTVIFSQFKPVVKEIYNLLNEQGIKTVMVTGDVIKTRMDQILSFKEDDTVRVLVATSNTMGTGFTLTEANQMFFFGPPWRDADFNQCCDRIHRIGQNSDVRIYTVLLDTGSEINVSTRMSKIMNWSKEMFDSAISVTESDDTDQFEEFQDKMTECENGMESFIIPQLESFL